MSQSKDDNFILRTSAPTSPHSTPYVSHGPNLHRDSGFSSAIYLPSSDSLATKQPLPHGHVISPIQMRDAISSPNLHINSSQGHSPGHSLSVPNTTSTQCVSNLSTNLCSGLNFLNEGHSVNLSKSEPSCVEEATNSLSTTLEDYHGQYRELEKLEDVVVTLEQVLRVSEEV